MCKQPIISTVTEYYNKLTLYPRIQAQKYFLKRPCQATCEKLFTGYFLRLKLLIWSASTNRMNKKVSFVHLNKDIHPTIHNKKRQKISENGTNS